MDDASLEEYGLDHVHREPSDPPDAEPIGRDRFDETDGGML